MQFQDASTIAALATPAGEGGVAVLRLSGSQSPQILKVLFKGGPPQLSDWQSHRLYYGKIQDRNGELLDRALAVWMKAPTSFTGEDVVELHLHGGRLIAWKVLDCLYREGARQALPGEFSQRAFLNGKMDLCQAEAIADMISAQSEQALKLAQQQWEGALSKPVSELRKKLLEALVFLEAAIDFPEEEIELLENAQIQKILEAANLQLKTWIEDYALGRILREGLLVVLVGKPNVGKSSLLNYLVRDEAAIVHDAPGTTRDAIEKRINLGGLALRLIDTAGIRDAQEFVEQAGIQRSKAYLEKADLVLALFDTSCPLSSEDFDLIPLLSGKKAILLLTKSDLSPQWEMAALPPELRAHPFLNISVHAASGLTALEEKIPSLFGIQDLNKAPQVLMNQLRHKQALEQASHCLCQALEALQKKVSPEWIASDVMNAAQHIGEIVGEVNHEHVLDEIFSRFCIGK